MHYYAHSHVGPNATPKEANFFLSVHLPLIQESKIKNNPPKRNGTGKVRAIVLTCSKIAGTCYQPRMQLLVYNNTVYGSFSIIFSTDSKARSSWMWQLETFKTCPLRNVVIWIPQLTCTCKHHSHGYYKTVFWRGLFFWASTQLWFTLGYILGHTQFPPLPAWYILAYLNYLLCEVQRFWVCYFFPRRMEQSLFILK